MTILEYKRYRKKSLRGRKKHLFFSRKKGRKKSEGGVRRTLCVTGGILIIIITVLIGKGTYSFFTTSPAFKVHTLIIKGDDGLKGVSRDGYEGLKNGKTLFALNLPYVATTFKKNPWIKDVSIRKVFPDKLVVNVKQRVPLAMINLHGLYFIDSEGNPFKKVSRYDRKVYPVITGISRALIGGKRGRNAVKKSLFLVSLIKGSQVQGNVSEINYMKGDGFSLILKKSGLRVKLGSRKVERSFSRLIKYYGKIKTYGKDMGYVNLKYSGKIIVGKKKGR